MSEGEVNEIITLEPAGTIPGRTNEYIINVNMYFYNAITCCGGFLTSYG